MHETVKHLCVSVRVPTLSPRMAHRDTSMEVIKEERSRSWDVERDLLSRGSLVLSNALIGDFGNPRNCLPSGKCLGELCHALSLAAIYTGNRLTCRTTKAAVAARHQYIIMRVPLVPGIPA